VPVTVEPPPGAAESAGPIIAGDKDNDESASSLSQPHGMFAADCTNAQIGFNDSVVAIWYNSLHVNVPSVGTRTSLRS